MNEKTAGLAIAAASMLVAINPEGGAGEPEGTAGYELWDNAHTATLEDYKLTDGDLFHPDAIK